MALTRSTKLQRFAQSTLVLSLVFIFSSCATFGLSPAFAPVSAAASATDPLAASPTSELACRPEKVHLGHKASRLTLSLGGDLASAPIHLAKLSLQYEKASRTRFTGPPAVGQQAAGFTGHATDVESDLVYARARYYDPSMGRFLSEDPVFGNIAKPFTTNYFAYANGNPTRYTDPDGRCSFTPYEPMCEGIVRHGKIGLEKFVTNSLPEQIGGLVMAAYMATVSLPGTVGLMGYETQKATERFVGKLMDPEPAEFGKVVEEGTDLAATFAFWGAVGRVVGPTTTGIGNIARRLKGAVKGSRLFKYFDDVGQSTAVAAGEGTGLLNKRPGVEPLKPGVGDWKWKKHTEQMGSRGKEVGKSREYRKNLELVRKHPNAHGLERHGGKVTDAQLETRARTGYAPDGSVKLNHQGNPILPPRSTAFHTTRDLVRADQVLRAGPLQAEIAANPGATVIGLKKAGLGFDAGRGFGRVGTSSYRPGTQGPLQRYGEIRGATAWYEKNPTTGEWETITIYPDF